MIPQATIAANLAEISRRIAAAAESCGRSAADVALVGVSKTQQPEAIEAAIAAGHTLFGENRVQEAAAKFPALRQRHPALRLHLIGPLQTNKIRDAVALFDAIETVDREKLARGLAAEMARSGRRPDCLIQVNIGHEPQKAGVLPAELAALVALCRDELALPLTGLMAIPPVDQPAAPYFTRLAELANRHRLPVLSMGMSADFEAAIRAGATLVRVGTAIFGGRPASDPGPR
jgi:pyridoxal phosphate enzyme (YggS family)